MDNYETGIYTDNPDDTLRYMQTTQPVDLWGYPKQEQDLVEIVRCKDCKYYLKSAEKCGLIDTRLHFYETDKIWTEDCFCSWGERRSE